eukprot:scaffold18013_cov48-Cyclotella_meneghiniana.AAC.2
MSPNYTDNFHFVGFNIVAVSVSLSDITRLSDLAAHLGVDVRAIQLVKLHPTAIFIQSHSNYICSLRINGGSGARRRRLVEMKITNKDQTYIFPLLFLYR